MRRDRNRAINGDARHTAYTMTSVHSKYLGTGIGRFGLVRRAKARIPGRSRLLPAVLMLVAERWNLPTLGAVAHASHPAFKLRRAGELVRIASRAATVQQGVSW